MAKVYYVLYRCACPSVDLVFTFHQVISRSFDVRICVLILTIKTYPTCQLYYIHLFTFGSCCFHISLLQCTLQNLYFLYINRSLLCATVCKKSTKKFSNILNIAVLTVRNLPTITFLSKLDINCDRKPVLATV